MSLRVIGAGLGRTGTASLKFALERLLAAPCYHMIEVFVHPEHVPLWHDAALGRIPDWNRILAGYAAAVDWPACGFWLELMNTYPEALVLLSLRDAQEWWESARETIFDAADHHPFATAEWRAMIADLFRKRWGADIHDREACITAFNAHNTRVRATVPAGRLLVWKAADGWEPICRALGLAVPAEPFPRANTREDWRARIAAYAETAADA
jgi:hypothetical protein